MRDYEERLAYELIYAGCEPEPGRFTNDVPVNAEVWLDFKQVGFSKKRQLLLTPHLAAGIGALRIAVGSLLEKPEGVALGEGTFLAVNESHMLAEVSFEQLLAILPLTGWWDKQFRSPFRHSEVSRAVLVEYLRSAKLATLIQEGVLNHVSKIDSLRQTMKVGLDVSRQARFMDTLDPKQRDALRRLVNLVAMYVGLKLLDAEPMGFKAAKTEARRTARGTLEILSHGVAADKYRSKLPREQRMPLWAVSVNRPAKHALQASGRTVKSDAAVRVFDTGGRGVRWAIIDSGIDARHPAFAKWDDIRDLRGFSPNQVDPKYSRVVRTLDFTRLADITSGTVSAELISKLGKRLSKPELLSQIRDIEVGLKSGRMLDWERLEPLLEVQYADYIPPTDSHGTHVAGILGSNWVKSRYAKLGPKGMEPPIELEDADLVGVAPEVELLDLRVFSEREGEDAADEFAILGALQYVRFLNQSKDRQFVHGVNLSLSLRHEVRSYACGSTPVCLECERLVGSGVVVVAAAGNFGYDSAYATTNLGGAYRPQSITDPGNSPSVITVGSTHRSDPYQYGISYFSSHGPTGDGRNKPDLVAPGEKIVSTLPEGEIGPKDGTSMAAPHVSGAAALLLSRNSELMGQPQKVKEILCKTATDLGRERAFQGHGLVDVLRALQSV